MQRSKSGKSYIRTSLGGAAILAIAFAHFAISQFISFQSKKDSVKAEAVINQTVEIETEVEARKSVIETMSKKGAHVSPLSEAEEEDRIVPRRAAVKQTVLKKKEASRESKAERLRRAEKLLTGV